MLHQCASLWVGPSLGPLERACLSSAVRHGHKVSLYCYRTPDGVPDGVELKPAADIVPEDRIIRHRTGSVSLFSNLFRYELQRRNLGTWIDCDAYFLAPLDMDSPYLIGEFEPGRVNGGVLRMPPDSPLLPRLIALFEERTIPSWVPLRARIAAAWRLTRTGRVGLADLPWGSTGPLALTALGREAGVLHHARSPDVLYPVRWEDAAWIIDPKRNLEEVTTERTLSIHLWNERIKAFKNDPAPPGSFLARIQAEGAQA